jgi:hypothetical protein
MVCKRVTRQARPGHDAVIWGRVHLRRAHAGCAYEAKPLYSGLAGGARSCKTSQSLGGAASVTSNGGVIALDCVHNGPAAMTAVAAVARRPTAAPARRQLCGQSTVQLQVCNVFCRTRHDQALCCDPPVARAHTISVDCHAWLDAHVCSTDSTEVYLHAIMLAGYCSWVGARRGIAHILHCMHAPYKICSCMLLPLCRPGGAPRYQHLTTRTSATSGIRPLRQRWPSTLPDHFLACQMRCACLLCVHQCQVP